LNNCFSDIRRVVPNTGAGLADSRIGANEIETATDMMMNRS
jgi:hypothetical protein